MKKSRKRLLLALELLAAVGLAVGIFCFQRWIFDRDRSMVGEEALARRHAAYLVYQGQKYPLKRQISTLLLIGTDNFADDDKQFPDYDLPYNFNLADFLVLLVFDHSAKTVTPFQICRDAMCEIPLSNGRSVYEQITLSHTYGSGGKDSCVITRNAVEGLLYGAPADWFVSFTMDTVPILNDLVGGVTVRLEEDIPALGPEYVRGAEVTLKGKDALRFVRYRDTSLLDDNLRRMAHHRLYLEAFTEKARGALADDQALVTKAFEKMERFLCTDLTVEKLSDLVRELCEYEIQPTVTTGGQYTEGERFPEFHVDDASLWEGVRATFCR